MDPLISIVIPTYNAEHYIEQALQSVLDQTLQDFEILIVDDCSTDRTVELVQSFKDNRIISCVNPQNSGPAYSRNRAIGLARGEWIAVLDGDDYWDLARLQAMTDKAKVENCDIIADDLKLFYQTGKVYDTVLRQRKANLSGIITPDQLVKYDLGVMQPLFRKAIIGEALCYNEQLRFAEDFDLYLRLLLQGFKWYQMQEGFYYYRQHSTSSVRKTLALKQQIVGQTESILNTTRLDGPTKKELLIRKRNFSRDVKFAGVLSDLRDKRLLKGVKALFSSIVTDPAGFTMVLKKLPKILIMRFRLKQT